MGVAIYVPDQIQLKLFIIHPNIILMKFKHIRLQGDITDCE
jgi:hypothetical protein